ncbi:MAG: 5'-3' exonuclease H3TH domain-containing protein, partial [Mariprofundaceae bacterium]
MPHLVLIDGPNYVFRAFHAIRQLTNSKGKPTNAVFGYVQMLRSVLDRLKPTHIAVAFDPKGSTFRNDIYPEYKAHRPPMPEDLAVQWPHVFEVTEAFRFPLICLDHFEADDVIATLARQAESKNWKVTIVSSDKDLMQLVGKHVHMLDTMKNVEYDAAAVKEKWGVEPERIHDLLSLAGDSSDNIPGVPGIGPKIAVELLGTYGDLEGVLAHAPEIKQKKRRANLVNYADDARLSYRLVALNEQAPVGKLLDELAAQPPDRKKLAKIFSELEFKRLLEEFSGQPTKENATAGNQEITYDQRNDRLVDNEVALKQLVAALKSADLIAVDTETISLACHDAELVGLSFSTRPGEGWYVPIGHHAADMLEPAPKQLPRDEVLEA